MMNKKIKIAVAVVLATAITGTGLFFGVKKVKMENYKNTDITLPKNFTITAHTGCMDTEDNTLKSIKIGVENGAKIVEFDVYFNADGTPVLSHDEPVGGEPTLDEAFAYLSTFEGIGANVDIKTVDALEKVYPLAVKNGVEDRIFYTGVNPEYIEAVQNDSPEMTFYLNIDVDKSKAKDEVYLQSLVDRVNEEGAIGINFSYKNATKELVDFFHKNGLLVSIYTVNDEFNMYKILSFEPDNITTRNPDKLSEIVKNYQ